MKSYMSYEFIFDFMILFIIMNSNMNSYYHDEFT